MSEAGALTRPVFPPLLRGAASVTPFADAIAMAEAGTDPGLILYRVGFDRLEAALILAPESPLAEAMPVALAILNGVADAFGALAPSEVGFEFGWPGTLLVNGAAAGRVRFACATRDPNVEPDWLVAAMTMALRPEGAADPGLTPDRTTLWDEGCGEVDPMDLLEAIGRHIMVRLHEWGPARLPRAHADVTGRLTGIGAEAEIAGRRGTLLGLDERGGALLRTAGGTVVVPLWEMLERP